MIGYVTLGSNDIAKAASFYDQLLAGIGARRFMDTDTFVAWAVAPGKPALSVIRPYDGKPATVGNGVMVALVVARALELGATDEGAPGPRGDNFYGGYFRDLDGNKLNFYCMS